MKTIIEGYNIDTENVSFEQTLPVVIRYEGIRKNNEVFPKYTYMNNMTGEEFEHERDITTGFHRGLELSYYSVSDTKVDIKYDAISGCLVFFLVKIDVNRNMKATPIPFLEITRFYITPNKNAIYYKNKADGEVEWIFIDKITKISDLPFNPSDYGLLNAPNSFETGKKYIMDVVKNVFNLAVNVAGNKSLCLDEFTNIMEFLMYKEPKQRKGPVQEKINKYCEIPVPEYVPELNVEQKDSIITEGRLLKLENNVLCIQMFSVLNDRKTYYEAYRMFIEPDGNMVTCKKNNCNQFVPTSQSLSGSHWKFAIRNYDEKAVENTQLAYYKSIINYIPAEYRGYAVWCFLNYDIFERLYKAGLKNYLNWFFSNAYDEPLASLSYDFYSESTNINSKNIYNAFGLNKYQFSRIVQCSEEKNFFFVRTRMNIVYYLKTIISGGYYRIDLSSIDNETFDAILDKILEIKRLTESNSMHHLNNGIDSLFSIFQNVVLTYGLKTLLTSIDSIIEIFDTNYYVQGTYIDYMRMVASMGLTSRFKVKFSNYDELKNAHDNIVAIYNLKKDEYKTKAFVKAVEKCNKFIYSDDKYTIVVPETPADMVNEGNSLHHCVKSYIERVIAGNTNIVFIRKTSDLETPFFTVEISNENAIEQIHGLKNRNLRSEPQLEYFVKDWIKKCKLSTTNYNKIR